MEHKTPTVTVIAVCYNHSRFVLECLESIRQQTYKNVQLIIMDDCSGDDSVDLIHRWITKHRLHCDFIPHAENKGLCKTLNEALELAEGKYLSLIATDDVWELDKIEKQVRHFETLPEDVGVLYSDAWQIDEAGNVLPEKFIEAHRKLPKPPEGDIYLTLVESNFIPAMSTMVRQSCFETVGKYDESLSYEDWDMWLRIAQQYKFVYSPIVSAQYRIVSTSLMRTIVSSQSCNVLKTAFLISAKCLRATKLHGTHRNLIKHRLSKLAEDLYRTDCAKRSAYLWTSFTCSGQLRLVFMFLCSLCLIKHSQFIRVETQIRRVLQQIKKISYSSITTKAKSG